MTDTPWIAAAKSQIGVKEYPGAPSNALIMKWAQRVADYLGINYTDDSIPWCGLFVAYCMETAGITPPQTAIRATSWAMWGVALTTPAPGAVMVFSRAGGGHVGFYVSEDDTTYHILGGNQADAVNITKIAKTRCTAMRWPLGVDLPTSGSVTENIPGALSQDEA